MAKKIVLGIQVTDRVGHAQQVQKLLTEFGCNIKTRLGLHEVREDLCATSGLLLLELFGEEAACAKLEKGLKEIPGLQVQKMVFQA